MIRSSRRFTAEDYEEARLFIQAAATQLMPDGRDCACCGDRDHQAWECHHNPLVMAAEAERLAEELDQIHDIAHRAQNRRL